MKIHPTAVLSGEIELEEGVEIGPFCHLQGHVKIKKGTVLEGHVTIGCPWGQVEIGESNHFGPGSVIGGPPQDVGYKKEKTRLKIGDHNVIRECVTVSIGTAKGDQMTTLGNNNFLMAYTHVGHDCRLGNHIVMANESQLGGHTVIDDHVVISAVCAFNQFSHIGKFAFIGGSSVVNKDILPFSKALGNHAVCRATNKVGLLRNGFTKEQVDSIHRAIRIILIGCDTIEEGLQRIQKECAPSEHIDYFIQFVRQSKRGIAK